MVVDLSSFINCPQFSKCLFIYLTSSTKGKYVNYAFTSDAQEMWLFPEEKK
jgi:hypothetical protein